MEKYQPIAINRKQDKNNREVIKMSETFKYKGSSERLSENILKTYLFMMLATRLSLFPILYP